MGIHAASVHREANPPRRDNRLRVLVVDDNVDLAQVITWLLRHCGFETQTVLSGHLVLATARSFRPHFILLDIGLPGLDGYQVAQLIRGDADLKHVVIIAVSAYGPDVHPGRSRQAGFNYHLTKPVSIDDLLPLLRPSRG